MGKDNRVVGGSGHDDMVVERPIHASFGVKISICSNIHSGCSHGFVSLKTILKWLSHVIYPYKCPGEK
jgi:hypothetical protein